jgi:NADH-quinone oxidoreductase subunit M
MFNKITNPENQKLKDLNKREWAILLPIVILIFWIGIYPKPLISRLDVSVNHLLTQVDEKYKVTLDRIKKNETMYAIKEDESIEHTIEVD